MQKVQYPLPNDFREQMILLLGAHEADTLFRRLEEPPPISIRLNTNKINFSNLSFEGLRPVPWCSEGYYLDSRPKFIADPLWHAGAYYVQEASSMFIDCVRELLPDKPLTALDLCAAPGGKSTLLLSLLPKGSMLVCNEYVRSRAMILRENIFRWGSPNCIVTHASSNEIGRLNDTFDLVLVDAPCSGEGMFRKDVKARSEWSLGAVDMCTYKQWDILSDIWSALRPGSILIYSTCTMNKKENEDILSNLVHHFSAEVLELSTCTEPSIVSRLGEYPCYRMMPHLVEGEGLFVCFVRKPKDVTSAVTRFSNKAKESRKRGLKSNKDWAEAMNWIDNSADYDWIETSKGEVFALDKTYKLLLEQIQGQRIQLLSVGIPVAISKGHTVLPHHALAHSTQLNTKSFSNVNLSLRGAIRFLAGETITLSQDLAKGWYTVSFSGVKLGFVKHLGNRSNNHYPDEWRIKHTQALYAQLPQEADTLT